MVWLSRCSMGIGHRSGEAGRAVARPPALQDASRHLRFAATLRVTRCRPRDAVLPWPQAELSAIGRWFNAALRWRRARGLRPWTVVPVGGLGLREWRFDLGEGLDDPLPGGFRLRRGLVGHPRQDLGRPDGGGRFRRRRRQPRQRRTRLHRRLRDIHDEEPARAPGPQPPHRRGHRHRGRPRRPHSSPAKRLATPSTPGLPDRPPATATPGQPFSQSPVACGPRGTIVRFFTHRFEPRCLPGGHALTMG